jgi:hypothetical protein
LAQSVKAFTDAENAKYVVVRDSIQARIQAVQQEERRGQIDPTEALARLEALNAEMVANEQSKADAIYAINLQGLHDREALYVTDPINLKKTQDLEVALAAQHQQQLTQIEAKGALDRQKIEEQAATQNEALWRGRVAPIVSSFGQQMQGLINATQTWHGAMLAVLGSIESAAFSAAERIVTNWIASEITKTAASEGQAGLRKGIELIESLFGVATKKTETSANIAALAAEAGAGGVASMAAAPFPIDLGAPAFGAAMAAAASGFGAVGFSAAGGWDIPGGVNPITQLHAEEMVLPASIANPLKKMVANSNFAWPAPANQSGQAPVAQGGGDIHVHISAIDSGDVERFFNRNGDGLRRAIQRQVRDLKIGAM